VSPDPKPQKRIVDKDMMRRLHLEYEGEPCDRDCGRIGRQLHHKAFRSQGGGDVRENLEWLCGPCHDEAHGL
jgi:5-methylcytosine-specific restriction endonuclease McrA